MNEVKDEIQSGVVETVAEECAVAAFEVIGAEAGVAMGGAMAGPVGACAGAMIGMAAGKVFSHYRRP